MQVNNIIALYLYRTNHVSILCIIYNIIHNYVTYEIKNA